MRELGGGQLIHSSFAFNLGDGPEKVYHNLMKMTNAQGEPYGKPELTEENELKPAA